MKRIGIIGSRHFDDGEQFHHHVRDCFHKLNLPFDAATCHDEYVIVTGDARGVDTLAVSWARSHDMLYVVFHAEAAWRTMGPKAGPIRTRAVVDYCEYLIALPDAGSKGTRLGIERARERGIPVAVREVVP